MKPETQFYWILNFYKNNFRSTHTDLSPQKALVKDMKSKVTACVNGKKFNNNLG